MSRSRPRTRAARRARGAALRLVVPVAVIVIWWFASAGSTSPYFPPLRTILSAFRQTWLFAGVGPDVVPSLERMLLGYVVACVIGVGLGVLLGRVPLARRSLDPLVQFGRAIPGVALMPIGIVLLGLGNTTKVVVIGFVCLFPVLLNTIDGVRSVDTLQLDVARSYQLKRRQVLARIVLPSAAPQISAGMRVSLAVAFVMMVITEMVASTNGIGYATLAAEQELRVPQMWAGMILLGLLGFGFNVLFVALERRVLRWHVGRRSASTRSERS